MKGQSNKDNEGVSKEIIIKYAKSIKMVLTRVADDERWCGRRRAEPHAISHGANTLCCFRPPCQPPPVPTPPWVSTTTPTTSPWTSIQTTITKTPTASPSTSTTTTSLPFPSQVLPLMPQWTRYVFVLLVVVALADTVQNEESVGCHHVGPPFCSFLQGYEDQGEDEADDDEEDTTYADAGYAAKKRAPKKKRMSSTVPRPKGLFARVTSATHPPTPLQLPCGPPTTQTPTPSTAPVQRRRKRARLSVTKSASPAVA